MKIIVLALAVWFFCFVGQDAIAQGQCDSFGCSAEVWAEAAPAGKSRDVGPSTAAAVRVTAGNSCGSGSVVGAWRDGHLVLTNAHVVGTRIGRVCDLRIVIDGGLVLTTGRVVMAAYSDRMLTDWALVHSEGLAGSHIALLSRDMPKGRHYTRGSPRCVWPLVSTSIVTADVSDTSPLWRWRPNSIPGQSGSGVWSVDDDLQYGLLTWTWGGLGAGQTTAAIYRQALTRSTAADLRPEGLEDVTRGHVVLENGFFSQAGITDLPIWYQDKPDPPGGDDEGRLIERLRERFGIDNFRRFLLLLLEFLELLDGRSSVVICDAS